MSLAPYFYRPMTPPEGQTVDPFSHSYSHSHSHGHGHSRNVSGSSYHTNTTTTNNTSPDSIITNITTPAQSPVLRQHGPTLLPRIRTHNSTTDSLSTNGPKKSTTNTHRRVLSATNNPPAFHPYANSRPQVQRSQTEPVECTTDLISPVSMVSNQSFYAGGSRANSAQPSPIPLAASLHRRTSQAYSHSRTSSASTIDDAVLKRFGYPTYRQPPVYFSQPQQTPSPTIMAPTYTLPYQSSFPMLDPPMINIIDAFDADAHSNIPIDLTCCSSRHTSLTPPPSVPASTSSLLTYLTGPTPPLNLVRTLSLPTTRSLSSHYWWDIRNIRPWTSFSLSTISTIPDLLTLLNFPHDTASFPSPGLLTTCTPNTEADLISLVSKLYFPKINTATRLSLGHNSPALYPCPAPPTPLPSTLSSSLPSFLANYPTDTNLTSHGLPRGRVVGLAKSYDRWNSGMRTGPPGSKVSYLKGLAHLQKAMRDHSCRYGFIVSEIELVCVRAVCDDHNVPYFGCLEVSEAIRVGAQGPAEMTVSLGLYFLLMLAKETPLPGQEGGGMDVGGAGALTRQRIWDGQGDAQEEKKKDGRDAWMPDPQVGEKRDAKTARGWVWPADPWHKREGGGVGRRGR